MRAAMWWIDRWRQSRAYSRMTAEEQGLYRNLCDEVVLRDDGVIEDDQRFLAKASGDHEAWARSGANVLKSMKKVRGGWTNETAMEVKAESQRRSKKQKDYRNRGGNEPGNEPSDGAGDESGNEPRPPEKEMNLEPKSQEMEIEPIVPPGRVVKAEPTAAEIEATKAFLTTRAANGTPMRFAHEEKQTATTTALRPQDLGFLYSPTQHPHQELAWAITRLVGTRGSETEAGRRKQAIDLLHDASRTPKGLKIETLDLRRVTDAWAKITTDRVIEIARDVYGISA